MPGCPTSTKNIYAASNLLRRSLRYFESNLFNRITYNIIYIRFQSCPWDIRLFERRSECHLAIDKPFKAISDLKAATKLMSDNTDAFFKLYRNFTTRSANQKNH